MSETKTALVTGASEGIGRAFAAKLAHDGYAITAVARSEERLSELTSSLGPEHRYIVSDLSTTAGVEAVQAELKAQRYDLLINNAGFGQYGPFIDQPLPDLTRMLRVNIEALVSLAHTYLSQARRGDALINISSVVAFLPMPQFAVYAATKAFVTSLSESLWAEQKSRGIFVMGFCPGPTATEFASRAQTGQVKAPDFMIQSAEAVVAEALTALRRHSQPTVVSGTLNRLSTGALRHLPRKQLVNLLSNAAR